MTEAEYRHMQAVGEFGLKASSWVQTPKGIRSRCGAILCERRYGEVFTFHNAWAPITPLAAFVARWSWSDG